MNDFTPNSQKDDLLSQISSQDVAQAAAAQKKKTQHSTLMQFVVLFMKLTFVLDDAKRKNKNLFKVLGWIWAVFMTVVYAGGICMLALLIYSYMHFPEMVRDNLIAQNIIVKDYNIKDFSFSKIELNNLEDKEGTYSIKKMTIHSTFSEFIRRRVKSVVLDGVKIKIVDGKDGIKLGVLPEALINLNQRPITRQVKVDNLSLTNAVLEINGQDYKLPVSFSLTGIYENNSKITIPLSIKERYAKIAGTLDISGNARQKDFVLQITGGTLTLPQHSPENITGEIKMTTRAMKIERITGNIGLSYGKNSKKFNITMDRENKDTFKGTLAVSFVNADSYDAKKEFKSTVSVNFEGMNFKSLYRFNTERPLKVTVASFQKQGIDISNLSATLNGALNCDDFQCTYRVRQYSPVFVKQSSILFDSDMIKSQGEYSFSLAPNKKDTFKIRQNQLDYDMSIERVSFSGYKNTKVAPVSLTAAKIRAIGGYTVSKNNQKMALDAQKVTIITPEVSLTDTSYKTQNFFDEKSKIQLSAGKVVIKDNDVVHAPFKVSLEKQGLTTNAVVGFENNAIQLSFSGVSRLLSGEFRGDVYLHEFDLASIKTPLNEISSLFPAGLKNVSGKMAALGKIYWKNTKQISGPLFVSLKNVDFSYDDTQISGLNTVLSLQTIEPLATVNNQRVFVSSIKGKALLQNVFADFKVENQFFKLSSGRMVMAGVPLTTDAALISLKSKNATLTFKNNNVDFAVMNPYLNLSGAKVSGKGSVSLPIEFRNGTVLIKNGEIKISDGVLDLKQNSNAKVENYFANADSYNVRTGTIFIDMESLKDTATVTLSLDGRLMPGSQVKSVREVVEEKIGSVLLPVPPAEVPQDIVKKQQIIVR